MINYEMALSEIEMYKKAHESLSENLTHANKMAQQFKEERDTLIDDLSWYKAKVSRLENKETNWVTENGFLLSYDVISDRYKQLKQDNKRLEHKNRDYKVANRNLADYGHEWKNEYVKLENKAKTCKSLLSEFSQHIGNKPSSSKYKYFRAKLDGIGIKERD